MAPGGGGTATVSCDTDFAVRVTYTWDKMPETFAISGNWASYLRLQANGKWYDIQNSGSNGTAYGGTKNATTDGNYTNLGFSTGTIDDALVDNGNGTKSLAFMFVYDAGAKTLAYCLGDVAFCTLTDVTLSGDGVLSGGQRGSGASNITNYQLLSHLNGASYTVEYSVPEPTALALLALGVAGLALRRRVA